MFEKLLKRSKKHEIFAKMKRKVRDRRYYLRHCEEIKQKRRDRYATYGK